MAEQPKPPKSPPGTWPELYRDDEISLLEVLVILARHKVLVFALPIASAMAAALLSLLLPDIYRGTARILPPQQNISPIAAAMLGSASALNAGGSIGQTLGLRNPSDLYVGMLRSRTIADEMIRRFDLQRLYKKRTLVDTREKLADRSDIAASQDGIINIKVDDEDPKRAAAMANTYVEQLEKLTRSVAVTTAGQQRVFLERQLAQVKDQLANAEVELRTTQEKTGLISLTDQGKATIESVAALRAEMAAKQVQLAAMRTAMTESNPDYVRAQQELSRLGLELAKLERSDPGDLSDVIPPAGKLPEAGLEYVRKLRNVRYYQSLFELIAKEYEIARSQEATEGALIQILDPAVVPDKRSKPHRLLIVLITAVVAIVIGMVGAFVLEAKERAKRHPELSKVLEELKDRLKNWHA